MAPCGQTRAPVFLNGEPQLIAKLRVHLTSQQCWLREVEKRVEKLNMSFGEQITFFRERRFHCFRRRRHRRARATVHHAIKKCGQTVDHRKENEIERALAAVFDVQQIVHVRNADLAGEAWIDGTAFRAALVQLIARVVAPHEVPCRHTE